MTEHLTEVFSSGAVREVQDNGRAVMEGLLAGPGGFVKTETVWEGKNLITIIIHGANK